MKFTEEEAFDELKRQLKGIVGDPAINDRAIKDTIATLYPMIGNDEMPLSDFATKLLPVLKASDGNARKYATNALKAAKAEEEKGKAAKEAEDKEKTAEQSVLETLQKRIEALETEKAENDRKSAVAAKRAELSKALSEKGVKDTNWINDLLSEVAVTEDTDVTAAADKYLKLYNRSEATTPENVSPKGATNPEKGGNPFEDVAQMRKSREVNK